MVRTDRAVIVEEAKWKDGVLRHLRSMGFGPSSEIDMRLGRIAQEFRGRLPKADVVIDSLVSGLLGGGERASLEAPRKRSPRRTGTRSINPHLTESPPEDDSSDSEEDDPSFAEDSSSSSDELVELSHQRQQLQEGEVPSVQEGHGQGGRPAAARVGSEGTVEPQRALSPLSVHACSTQASGGRSRATKAPAGKENSGDSQQPGGRQAPSQGEPATRTRSWTAEDAQRPQKSCKEPGRSEQGRLERPLRLAPRTASLAATGQQAITSGCQKSRQKQAAQATAGCSVTDQSGPSRVRHIGISAGRRVLQASGEEATVEGGPAKPSQHRSLRQEWPKDRQEAAPGTQGKARSEERADGSDQGPQEAGGICAHVKSGRSQGEGVLGSKRLRVMDSGCRASRGRPSGTIGRRGTRCKEKPRLEVIVHPSPSPFRGPYPFDMGPRLQGFTEGDTSGPEKLDARFDEAADGPECEASEEGPLDLGVSGGGVPNSSEGLVDGGRQAPEQQCQPLGGASQSNLAAGGASDAAENLWLLVGAALLDTVGEVNGCSCGEDICLGKGGPTLAGSLPTRVQLPSSDAAPDAVLPAPSASDNVEGSPLHPSPTFAAALPQPTLTDTVAQVPSSHSLLPSPEEQEMPQPCSREAAAPATLTETQAGLATQAGGRAPGEDVCTDAAPKDPGRPGCSQTGVEGVCASGSEAVSATPEGEVLDAVAEALLSPPVSERAANPGDVTPAQSVTGEAGVGTSAGHRSSPEAAEMGVTCSQVLSDVEAADSGPAPSYLSDCTEVEGQELEVEAGKSVDAAGAESRAVEELPSHEYMALVASSPPDPSRMELWPGVEEGCSSHSPDQLIIGHAPATGSTKAALLPTPKPPLIPRHTPATWSAEAPLLPTPTPHPQRLSKPGVRTCSSPVHLAEAQMATARLSASAQQGAPQGLIQSTAGRGAPSQSDVKLTRWSQAHPANVAARAAAEADRGQGGVSANAASLSGHTSSGDATIPDTGLAHLHKPREKKRRRFTEKPPQWAGMPLPQAPAMALPRAVTTLSQASPPSSLAAAQGRVKPGELPDPQEPAVQQPEWPGLLNDGCDQTADLANPVSPEHEDLPLLWDPTLLSTPPQPRLLSPDLPSTGQGQGSVSPRPSAHSAPELEDPTLLGTPPQQPQSQPPPLDIPPPPPAAPTTTAQAGPHTWHRDVPPAPPLPFSSLPVPQPPPPLPPPRLAPLPTSRTSAHQASHPTVWQRTDTGLQPLPPLPPVGWHYHAGGAPLAFPPSQHLPGFPPAAQHLRPMETMVPAQMVQVPFPDVPVGFPHSEHSLLGVPEQGAPAAPSLPVPSMPFGIAAQLAVPPLGCHYKHDFTTGYSLVPTPPSLHHWIRQDHAPHSGAGHASVLLTPDPRPQMFHANLATTVSHPYSGVGALGPEAHQGQGHPPTTGHWENPLLPQAPFNGFWSGSHGVQQQSYSQPYQHEGYSQPYQHETYSHLFEHHRHHGHHGHQFH